jgi:hypothetical protein
VTAPFRVDTSEAEAFLDGLYKDQIPFAASLALNRTAKDVQDAERGELAANLILRQPQFILQSVRIPKFSNKNDSPMEVTVEIGEKAGFLRKFQAPGVKQALDPAMPIAIPSTNIRPSISDLVPLGLYPKNLRLVPRKGVTGILAPNRHITSRGVIQLKGKQRTFVLDPAEHRGVKVWGVYQRFGPGPHDVRLLWTYKSRIPIPKRFDFFPVGERTIAERWPIRWAEAYAEAIRSAR